MRAIKESPNPHAADLIKARGHRRDQVDDDATDEVGE